jgi:hypothetical protein
VRRNEVGTPAAQSGGVQSSGIAGRSAPARRRDFRPVLAIALLCVATLAMFVSVVITRHGRAMSNDPSALFIDLILAAYLVYAVMGTLILVHRPGNTVGWIVGTMGFFPLVGSLAEEYFERAYVRHETTWPLLQEAHWLGGWYFLAAMGALPLLFLLYPDGRPLSRRWRPLVGLAIVGLVLLLLIGMLGPGDDPELPNPYAISLPSRVDDAVAVVATVAFALAAFGGLLSLAVRYRRARGVERQQVTWLFYGAGLGAALILPISELLNQDWTFPVGFALPGLAIGVALLRYRLYDIDRLVSRTVSYAVLTAFLALPYVLVVTTASRVAGSNQLAVALATLAAAAAFNPLRRRIQNRVDRRFNRARYDAGRTVEAFTQRLREEIDLQTVREDLLAVVAQTVQPTSASLWLRGGP